MHTWRTESGVLRTGRCKKRIRIRGQPQFGPGQKLLGSPTRYKDAHSTYGTKQIARKEIGVFTLYKGQT